MATFRYDSACIPERFRSDADFTQILRTFHAQWFAESQRNRSGNVAESFRNRLESFRNTSASLAESI